MEKYQKKIEEYFTSHIDEMLGSLKEIMSIDSSRGEAVEGMPYGKGSAAALKWATDFAEKNGFSTRNFDNRCIDIDYQQGEACLGVLSHLDVVPAGDGWHYPPFDCTVENDIIYGRGAIDDKGPSVAVLYSMKCIKELGIKLSRNFRAIFGGDEENGCKDIEYYQTKEKFPPMVFTPDGSFPVLNCEKGMVHLTFSADFEDGFIHSVKGGSVINAVPDTCIVAMGDISKIYNGKSAHGSRPENGDNAITKFLAEYSAAPYGSNKLLLGLAKLFPYNEPDGKACGLACEDKISGPLTVALTILKTEKNRLCGGIDIRFPIDKTVAEIRSVIVSRIEEVGFTVDDCDSMEPHYVPEDSLLVQTLLKTYENVLGEKGECIAEGGITYVHNTEGGVAFGAEFPDENNNMHGDDEHITMKTFMINCNMYCNAIIALCK